MSKKRYSLEFKKQACQLVQKEGYSIADAARELGILPQTLTNWVHRDSGKPVEATSDSDDPKVLKAQIRTLKARLRRSEMEKDILKKATAYFAKENQ